MLIFLLTAQTALADIPPARIELDCPRGSTQILESRRWICSPNAACQSDADCGEGKACEPVSLCIETSTVTVRSGIMPDGSPNIRTATLTQASDACGIMGLCKSGDCSGEARCVAAPPAEPAPPAAPSPAEESEAPAAEPEASTPGGTCASLPAATGPGLMLAALLGLWRRRRAPLA